MLKHPDPEVQCIIETLEEQRDQAAARAASNAKRVAELTQECIAANKENEELKAALMKAAEFQNGGNVIEMKPSGESAA